MQKLVLKLEVSKLAWKLGKLGHLQFGFVQVVGTAQGPTEYQGKLPDVKNPVLGLPIPFLRPGPLALPNP